MLDRHIKELCHSIFVQNIMISGNYSFCLALAMKNMSRQKTDLWPSILQFSLEKLKRECAQMLPCEMHFRASNDSTCSCRHLFVAD